MFINFASEDWQKYICSKLKVKNRNIKKRCETCLKLKLRYQAEVNDVSFIIKLNIFHTFFHGFCCLIWLLKMLFIPSNWEMFTWNHYFRHLHYLTREQRIHKLSTSVTLRENFCIKKKKKKASHTNCATYCQMK